MMMFRNRQAAGRLLAKRLVEYKNYSNTQVLAIPRGGVVVAYEVAKALRLPLDIVITRKIGAPHQPELAVGAVDPDGKVVWQEGLLADLELGSGNLDGAVENQVQEIKRREQLYRQDRQPLDITGKTVILVDDGIATGATVLSAIRYLKRHRVRKIILAVPVAAASTMDQLKPEVDEAMILYQPDSLGAVGQFYHNFEPVADDQVIKLLS